MSQPTCPNCDSADYVKPFNVEGVGIKFYCHKDTCKRLVHTGKVKVRPPAKVLQIAGPQYTAWNKQLKASAGLQYLTEVRGLTEEIIDQYQLGWDGRIVIPIPNAKGDIINLRTGGIGEKLHGLPEIDSCLFPQPVVGPQMILCEGEWDTLRARSLGFNAYCGTAGAGSWPKTWTQILIDSDVQEVVVIYDADHPGRLGSNKVCSALRDAVPPHRIFSVELTDGQDLSDWLDDGHGPEDLTALIKATPARYARPMKEVDRTVHELSLAEAGKAEMAGKWARFEATIAAAAIDPAILPTKLSVNCSKNKKKEPCGKCDFWYQTAIPIELPLNSESPKFLEMIDSPDRVMDEHVRRELGIPLKCGGVTLDPLESVRATKVRLVESFHVEADKEIPEVAGVAMGIDLQPNKAYKLTARTVPHPKTQILTHVISKEELAEDDLDTFEPDKELLALLKVTGSLSNHVDKLLEDAARLTGIWERPDLHFLVLLAYHSNLWIQWDEKTQIRGWLDVLIMGDTGQGKTTVTNEIMESTGLGDRCVLKAVTRAGLLGGQQEVKGQTWIAWGADPRNDRRLVIYEELKGASQEVLAALTDARSSGVAEVVLGRGGRRKAHARTRRIGISNPRHHRSIGEHGYGVLAVPELVGAAEDVRRYDMALLLATGEVDERFYRRDRCEDPVFFRGGRLRESILRAWSRPPIALSEDTREACKDWGARLAKRFTPRVPLVEGADHRQKLARLTCALANLLQTKPRPEHVELVATWQDEVYSSPVFGYRDLTISIEMTENVRDGMVAKRAVEALGGEFVDTCQLLLQMPVIDRFDFVDLEITADQPTAFLVLTKLVRNNALVKDRKAKGYLKTPGFVKLLKEWVREKSV